MGTVNYLQDVIDSRDIIERIEYLEREQADLVEQLSNGEITESDMLEFDKNEGEELDALRALAAQCEGCGDWEYGAQLIRESYFTDYIEELINECYEMPEQLNSGLWPYRHITIDYEAAADEAKQDYTEVDYGGVSYLIRA